MKKSTCAATLAATILFLPQWISAQMPQLEGIVASSADNSVTGLYSISANQGTDWTLQFEIDSRTTAIYSGVRQGDMYYATRVNGQYGTLVYLDAYDLTTNTKVWTNYLYSAENLPHDLTLNEADGKIYGLFLDSSAKNIRLATVDYVKDGTVITEIAPLEGNWSGLASDSEGNLYTIRIDMAEGSTDTNPIVEGSTLCKIDRHTGEVTPIGSTGQLPYLLGSATIETRSNRMFWSVAPNQAESYLCEVDLQTGVATKLYDFEGTRQVVALYAPIPAAEDTAPAAVENAAVSFADGGLDGYVSFTSPSTLFNGTPAEGPLSYTVTLDGYTVASGETSFGASENIPVSVSERGLYKFMVAVANSTGSSPKVEVSGFAGFGTPDAPASVSAVKNNGKFVISWEPVATTVDGGFIDPSKVTYNVVRLPDNVAVASSVSETSVEVAVDDNVEMTAYSFQVTALNGEVESAPAVSGNVVAGTPVLPWTETFDSEDSLRFFSIIDANGDDKTWGFYNDCVRINWNSTLDMDDWLILPALALKGGMSYKVVFNAKSENPSYPETIEAKWGVAPTPDALANVLVEPVKLVNSGYQELAGYISAPEDGTYYVGIHGISEADTYYLAVDDISVEAGVNNNAPGLATDITVTPDAGGEWSVEMSLSAPQLSIGEENLTELSKVEVVQGSAVLHTFESPVPGETLSCRVDLVEGGNVTLTVTAYNQAGAGLPAEVSFFAGTPKVARPESVAIAEPSDGNIKLEWAAVTMTEDGVAVNPSKVAYNIYDVTGYEPVLVESGIETTEYSFAAVAADEPQKFVQYGVSAVTDGGETEQTLTACIPVGTPYENYTESFADGEASTLTRFERVYYGNWAFVTGSSEAQAQDGDNGLAVMNGYFSGYSGILHTGKVSLGDLSNPTFRFYSYTPDNENADKNVIAVSVNDGSGLQEVYRSTVAEIGQSMGWHLVEIPLAQYAGKTVSFSIYAETSDRPYTATYIDNLAVVDVDGEDLEMVSFTAPKYVRIGEEFMIEATVRNNSAFDVEGYEIDILANGEVVYTLECGALEAMTTAVSEIALPMSPVYTEAVTYVAQVVYANDPRPENDGSAPLTVKPVASALPAPEGLKGSHQDSQVTLQWSAPEIAAAPAAPVSEDFESAEAWSHEVAGWLFIDADNAAVAGFGETQIPGITAGETHCSFFTFSATGIFEGNNPLAPHSGKQYLAALARFDSGLTDDWAISPELSGEEQTISFWAQSYDATNTWMEAIEVLYSEGSIYTKDFMPTGFSKNPLPNGWTKYEVTLPAGARRFAIHSSSRDSFMLMLDDVVYQPASTYNAQILGYNLYRDNVKVNEELITSLEYTDIVDDPMAHLWAVSTVYSAGESSLSEQVASSPVTGVDTVATGSVAVYGATGSIHISGAEGADVTIASADGKVLFSGSGRDSMSIAAPTGIYVVNVGDRTYKVIVR